MIAEVQRIASSEIFRKSPILVKLLTYLCRETVAGRGALLKSYTVAVDGLGRSADFDAQGDSYPRVQIARLRKLLDAYYAVPGTPQDACIHIPLGTYYLELGGRAPAATDPAPAALRHGGRPGWLVRLCAFRDRTGARCKIVATVMTIVALGMGYLYLRAPAVQSVPPITSAILVVAPMGHDADPQSNSLAQDATAQLIDGLSHSWVARVDTSAKSLPKDDSGHAYRLETQLGPSGQSRRALYARLFDQAGATVLWSRELALPADSDAAKLALDSLIAELGGSYGVIALREGDRLKDSFAPGYACLLQYLRFQASRNPQTRDKVQDCLAQPATEARLEGPRQATRAMFVLDIPPLQTGQDARMAHAREWAERAIDAYPRDHFTQLAAARLAIARRDCAAGVRHAKLSIANNNTDPLALATLAALTQLCGNPDAPAIAERAFHFQINGDSSARLPLILCAITTHRQDWLEILANLPKPSTSENSAFTYLCNTMLFAALDRHDAAIRNWQAYQQALGSERSPDSLLSEYLVSDTTRAGILAFLTYKHVIT